MASHSLVAPTLSSHWPALEGLEVLPIRLLYAKLSSNSLAPLNLNKAIQLECNL